MDHSLGTPKKANNSQIDRFKEAARELGVDEDEGRFRATLRQITRADVPPAQRKKPKRSEKSDGKS